MPKDMEGVMKEFKQGKLHSGSKKGPKVKNRKQAIAIGLSEQRQMGKSAHGSGEFSKADMDRGYKVEYSSTVLAGMDCDRLEEVKDYTLANRRNGTTGGPHARKNLRRSEY